MERLYVLKSNKKIFGPVKPSDLKKMVAVGSLARDDKIGAGREGPWRVAGEIKGLFADGRSLEQDRQLVEDQPPARAEQQRLVDCPSCEHKCSQSARCCPQCGHPFERMEQEIAQRQGGDNTLVSLLWVIAGIAFLGGFFLLLNHLANEAEARAEAAKAWRKETIGF